MKKWGEAVRREVVARWDLKSDLPCMFAAHHLDDAPRPLNRTDAGAELHAGGSLTVSLANLRGYHGMNLATEQRWLSQPAWSGLSPETVWPGEPSYRCEGTRGVGEPPETEEHSDFNWGYGRVP